MIILSSRNTVWECTVIIEVTDRRGKFSLGQFYYNFARVWNVIITLVSRDENFKYERSFDSLSIRCKFLFAITNTSRKKHDKKVIFAQFSNLDENRIGRELESLIYELSRFVAIATI